MNLKYVLAQLRNKAISPSHPRAVLLLEGDHYSIGVFLFSHNHPEVSTYSLAIWMASFCKVLVHVPGDHFYLTDLEERFVIGNISYLIAVRIASYLPDFNFVFNYFMYSLIIL